MLRRTKEFNLNLEIKDNQFVTPPLESQRYWLLNSVMDEAKEQLNHLNGLSKDFIPGAQEQDYRDRMDAGLSDDEIMEDWQFPLMKKMAQMVTEDKGHVLEIGFGRGVSSSFIQEGLPKKHTIIECNQDIVENRFAEWKKNYPNQDVEIHLGKWQDVLPSLGQFDSIFFHTYPLTQTEYFEQALNSVTFAEHFFEHAANHLKDGGIFTYLTHEFDSLSREHQRLIFKYFSSFKLEVVKDLNIPKNTTDAWWYPSMAVVKVYK